MPHQTPSLRLVPQFTAKTLVLFAAPHAPRPTPILAPTAPATGSNQTTSAALQPSRRGEENQNLVFSSSTPTRGYPLARGTTRAKGAIRGHTAATCVRGRWCQRLSFRPESRSRRARTHR